MLTAASGTGGAKRPAPVHHAVTHTGRPVVHHVVLTAAFKPPAKAKPHRPTGPKFPVLGKLPKPKSKLAVPLPGNTALAIQQAKSRASIPHAPTGPVSPYVNPFARSGGVVGQRIDQGVDYTGKPGAPIGALGPGKIVSAQASGSGWPGGGFIGEQLTAGPAKGQVSYVAEDVAPTVKLGQSVKAGQTIGQFTPGGSIETGWGTLPPNVGQALAYGKQSAPGSDPGAYSTGFGIAYNRLLTALGAPSGRLQSTISGGAPPLFSATGGKVPTPSKGHISLPPALPPASGVHGVNPPSTRPVSIGPIQLDAVHIPERKAKRLQPRNVITKIKTGGPPTTGGPVPVVTTTPTKTKRAKVSTPIFSSYGRGNALGPVAAPSTTTPTGTGSASSSTALWIVGGVAVVLLLVFMHKKGKGKGGKPSR